MTTTANQQKGFTLIEILLYTGLAAVIITLTASMAVLGLQARARTAAVNYVEQEAVRAVDTIAQLVRNAESVSVSGGDTLTLTMPDAADSPTVVAVSSGALTISQGGGTAVAVTSGAVTVSSFALSDRSYADTPGTVDFAMSVQANPTSNRAEFTYETTSYATVSLRQ